MARPHGLWTAQVRGRARAAVLAVPLALVPAACGTAHLGASGPASSAPAPATPAAPGWAPGSAAAGATGASSYVLARLAVIMKQMIRNYGGTHVDVSRGVRTDRASALALGTPGDDAGEGRGVPTFLLQAEGDFIAENVPMPYGAKPPTGHQLMIIVDTRSLTMTDAGLNNGHADIARLGPVFQLRTTG